MGDAKAGPVRLSFTPHLRVEFHGATVTSDAELLLPRERRETSGALTSTQHWFDTDGLVEGRNDEGLARLNRDLVQHEAARPLPRRLILDIDSFERPGHGGPEQSADTGYVESVCYHPLFVFNQDGDCGRVSCNCFRANEVRWLLGVIAYNLGNLLRRLVRPLAIQSWSLTSLLQRLFKAGGRLIWHARYFVLQLAESYLTPTLFRQLLGRIERLAGHPT